MIMPMGSMTLVVVRCHFFGDEVEAIAAEAERQWKGWLESRFSYPSHVTDAVGNDAPLVATASGAFRRTPGMGCSYKVKVLNGGW